jgi:hypothetical protein
MKVYGFNELDVARGELRAVEADNADLHFEEEFKCSLDWEYLSRRFSAAKSALLERMKIEGSDPELIDAVKGFKASFISVE